jgi:4-amino-4-deoxy-L-arabinose transferase-like glycosyltransferase
MTMTATQTRASPTAKTGWQPYALGAIVVLSLGLYAWGIGSEGWGNTFYSAAVKSMSHNLTNFLFGSFDPAGVVTVDKPPMAFWPQVLSTSIFGFHGWSLLLPQVIEGGAAVFLLHRTVRRWAGENVALLAALILAVTPITVAIDRDNNPDTMLTLLCVAAAYAFTRSVEPGISSASATRWLSQAAFWVGCGFVTKMLAGWMIVPALAFGYLAGRNTGWGRRVVDLLAAGAVLLAASLWWVALTAWWPGQKPYIGGSTNGSAWDLIIGYNGLGRVFGEGHGGGGAARGVAHPAHAATPPGGGGGAFGGGQSGVSRLFGDSVGGQISWLIPLCLLALVVVSVAGVLAWRRKLPADHFTRAGWVLWGSWLLVLGLVFSAQQGIFHSYYTTQLAPAIAALAAAGLAVLWRYRNASGPAWLLLPAGLALTAVWAWVLISRDTTWNGWARYAVEFLALAAIAGLVASRFAKALPASWPKAAMAFGLVAVLLTPALWSGAKAVASTDGALGGGAMASAGPPGSAFGGMKKISAMPGMPNQAELETLLRTVGGSGSGAQLTADQRRILAYVTKNAGGAQIVLAVEGGSMQSSGYIIDSDAAVIGMGGFSGSDNAPSVGLLTSWKAQGRLGFVLSQVPKGRQAPAGETGLPGGFGGSAVETEREVWVQKNCTAVPASAYGGTAAPETGLAARFGRGAQTLYDCLPR